MTEIPEHHISNRCSSNSEVIIALFLVTLTLVVYWVVQNHGFLVWDDYEYVVENPHVRTGLNLENVIWAFTSTHASNWHPLTWISHMVDCELYGLNPAGHHLNNLLLHSLNTILLFFLLVRMTHGLWQSAFVAAVFAVHPLHVESVAWVAERKDLLSTFFFMLTCLAYIRYTHRFDVRAYFLSIVLFAFGLASKPMLVTLPILLLLLDYWPLARIERFSPSILMPLFIEKLPFLALSALSCLVTIGSADASQAVASLEFVPIGTRLGNAVVSYAMYLIKMFSPTDLAFFYPHPLGTLSIWKVLGSSIFLALVSLLVFMARKNSPFLLMGWLWYIVTLLPAIGIIQVGSQARADRYTYVPLIGVSIMAAWGVAHEIRTKTHGGLTLGLASAVILCLSLLTSKELDYWKSGEALFTRAMEVTRGNYTAHYQLGNEYLRQGMMESAIHHFSEAVKFRPDHFLAHQNLGLALASQGRLDQALTHLRTALRVQPRDAGILSGMGDVFSRQGDLEQAISSYSQALRIDPSLWKVHNNLGLAFLRSEREKEAAKHFEDALRLNPNDEKARHNLELARKKMQSNQ